MVQPNLKQNNGKETFFHFIKKSNNYTTLNKVFKNDYKICYCCMNNIKFMNS